MKHDTAKCADLLNLAVVDVGCEGGARGGEAQLDAVHHSPSDVNLGLNSSILSLTQEHVLGEGLRPDEPAR
jgi:hypothetical protein